MLLRKLKKGGTIGTMATAFPADTKAFQAGVSELEHRGYRVKYVSHPTEVAAQGFAFGSGQERAEILHTLLEDEEIDVVIAARGGYGTVEMLPYLNFELIRDSKKAIVGFSDVTVLLNAVAEQSGIPTIHGPALAVEIAKASSSSEDNESLEALLSLLEGAIFPNIFSCRVLRGGSSEGRIVAGNLAMLNSLIGTPWDIDLNDALLFLEDVNEAPYRIHRSLLQLSYAGKLDSLSGLVFGQLSPAKGSDTQAIEDMLEYTVTESFKEFNFPILAGFPFGHFGKNMPIPIGCRASLCERTVSLLESPINE